MYNDEKPAPIIPRQGTIGDAIKKGVDIAKERYDIDNAKWHYQQTMQIAINNYCLVADVVKHAILRDGDNLDLYKPSFIEQMMLPNGCSVSTDNRPLFAIMVFPKVCEKSSYLALWRGLQCAINQSVFTLNTPRLEIASMTPDLKHEAYLLVIAGRR